jgi:hypothetical protein
MLTRRLLLSTFALLLSGCALFQTERAEVRFDAMGLALLYADTKAEYAVLVHEVGIRCKDGRLDEKACARLALTHERVQLVDVSLREAIMNPTRPVDWQKVADLVRLVLSVARGFF